MRKRRQIIGWILLGIGIICCSISLLRVRRTVSDAYSASCREREENGPFFYPEDLISVKGIGKAKLALFRDNLNMSAE